MRTKLVLALVLLAAALSAAALLPRDGGTQAPVARITRDGVLVEEIPLDGIQEPRSFTLEDASGSNRVEVEAGRIRIAQADCPDQICVKQGWVSDGTMPIVCLPHRLMIEIVGGGGGLDGAAG